MDRALQQALENTRTLLTAAIEDIAVVEEQAQRDPSAALVQIHMGFKRHLEDARNEALEAAERLVALGGVYPPLNP